MTYLNVLHLKKSLDTTIIDFIEIRIKDKRMQKILPKKRPFYSPYERMAILELKASRGWSSRQTADVFNLRPETISNWTKRVDEHGENALLKSSVPVNKFSDIVTYIVQRLKILCPALGRKKIAHMLCRAGAVISSGTVGRMQNQPPDLTPDPKPPEPTEEQHIISRHPNHTWLVDMTVVPTSAGFWVPWFPFSLSQVFPFCYWVAVIVDHFSRTCVGFAVFKKQPGSKDITTFLNNAISRSGKRPKYIISDKGKQFFCKNYKKWCRKQKIKPRFGAVGKYGSISIVERFIKSLKNECVRKISVPSNMQDFRKEVVDYIYWYNEFRPHESLDGRVPIEVYLQKSRRITCYNLQGADPDTVNLELCYFRGRKHLPVINLRKVG